ncbi:MAG TPA: TRAP transporter substrate-binding protein [Alphaproteobacteria bacterium]|nr:TRAP transporter substrate-binding protein [Alphaproteobacteria bacterium]
MRNLLKTVAAGTVLLAASTAAAENWDLPAAYPANNYHTETLQSFADMVAEKTDGEITITVHPNGSLYKGEEIKRAVQTGQAQIGERLISALSNEDPLFGLDAVPFLASDFESARKLYEASRPAFEELLASQNLHLLYTVVWPPQGLYTQKPIETAADMQGVKFRAYNPATARLSELTGAVPTQIEAAEVPQAFATGTVESMISSGATGYDSKLWEHAAYFYDVQAWLPKNMIFVNLDVWEDLGDEQRQAIEEAAAAAEEAGWARAEELAQWYKDELAANGMTVAAPSEQFKAELQEIGATMTEEWLANAGETGKEVVEKYRSM